MEMRNSGPAPSPRATRLDASPTLPAGPSPPQRREDGSLDVHWSSPGGRDACVEAPPATWRGEDKFEINFLSEAGDIAFHVKPRFSSATMVGNTFQGGRWGQEEVSGVFPLVLGEPFEMEVSSDAEHFHVHAQDHKVLQFAHRHRPLAGITRVQVLSDHRLAQVELARRDLSWWDGGH
uniref:grifin n=1 Tax=Panthera onca TaxID=9690 RepID=UPI0029540C7D|nr:grifin [Panthera onca]